MKDSEIIIKMEKMGFKNSDYETFDNNESEFELQNFHSGQVGAIGNNLDLLKKLPTKERKFYIVRLSKKNNDVRAWSHS